MVDQPGEPPVAPLILPWLLDRPPDVQIVCRGVCGLGSHVFAPSLTKPEWPVAVKLNFGLASLFAVPCVCAVSLQVPSFRCWHCHNETETLPYSLGIWDFGNDARIVRHHAVKLCLVELPHTQGYTWEDEVGCTGPP